MSESIPGGLRAAACLVLALAACSSAGHGTTGGGANADAGEDAGASQSCPDGFLPDPAGAGCLDVTPAQDCPAGTRAALGSTACQTVGWTGPCPAGFQSDPSGWGCHEVLPAAACTGATYESLGSTTCQPIGDCTTAFPPAGAALFVSASYTASQTDATHFTTIGAAVAAAPAGAIVAVDSGTYTEAVTVASPVSVIGRCAEKVILQSPGGEVAGFQVTASGVTVHGLTMSGFRGAVVETNGAATVDACLVQASISGGLVAIGGSMTVTGTRIVDTVQGASAAELDLGFGVFVTQGAKVTVTQSAIVDSTVCGLAVSGPADAKVTQSIIVGTRVHADNAMDPSAGSGGSGLAVDQQGTAEITNCAIIGNHNNGVEADTAGAIVTVQGSIVRDTLADINPTGNGLEAASGGIITIDSSALVGNANLAMAVAQSGSKVTATNTVVRGVNATGALVGQGITVDFGATLSLTGVAIVGMRDGGLRVQGKGTTATVSGSLVRDTVPFADPSQGYSNGIGLLSTYGASSTVTDTTVASNTDANIVVGSACDQAYPKDCGGSASLSKLVVLSARPDATGNFGVGLQAANGATLAVDSSVFASNYQTAVILGKTSSSTITGSVLRGTGVGTKSTFGYGLVVIDGATAEVSGSSMRDNLGVGVAVDGSELGVDSSFIANNQVGVYVASGMLQELAAQPAMLSPLEVAVSQTQFIGNATRVSSTQLPLPTIVTPGAPAP